MSPSGELNGVRVLIVEDDERVMKVMSRPLEARGATVVTAADGVEGLKAYRAGGFDLLISDLRMPRMGGHTLVKMVRSRDANVPIIIVSGFGDMDDVDEAFSHGISEFISKPFRPAEFCNAVLRAVGRAEEGAASAPASQDEPAPEPQRAAAPEAEPARVEPSAFPLQETLDQIAAGIRDGSFELPGMDPAAAQLVQLLSSKEPSAQRITQLIERSPTLASRVVTLSNTAYYRGVRAVTNLREAVVRIGHRTIVNLAMTVVHGQFHSVRSPQLAPIVTESWEHTVFAAAVARELSRAARTDEPEDVYLAALFCDVGEMAVVRALDAAIQGGAVEERALDSLRRVLVQYHEHLGAAILNQWRFPAFCVAVAKTHQSIPLDPKVNVRARRCAQLLNIGLRAAADRYGIRRLSELPSIDVARTHAELKLTDETVKSAIWRAKQATDGGAG